MFVARTKSMQHAIDVTMRMADPHWKYDPVENVEVLPGFQIALTANRGVHAHDCVPAREWRAQRK